MDITWVINAEQSDQACIKIVALEVVMGVSPGGDFGLALKIDDGNMLAATVAVGELLAQIGHLSQTQQKGLALHLQPPITNRVGLVVGQYRPVSGLAGA